MTAPRRTPAVRARAARLPTGVRIRRAVLEDLPDCARIWRDSLNDYLVRLNQREIPDDVAALTRLHAHVLETDPEQFLVAVRAGRGGDRVVGFVAATRRDSLWFLSMLFVDPAEQGAGLGRALLERVMPRDGESVLATATDSQQPISNALYARYGIVPRMPLLALVGRPDGRGPFGKLPAGVSTEPFDTDEAMAHGRGTVGDALDRLDREVAGFAHPADHAFVAREGRRGFLFRQGRQVVGYGYGAESGRTGPIAVRDAALMPAVLGHVLTTVEPRGASAIWAPGLADGVVVPLLRAGFRIDQFPLLLCWTAPFADFCRYVPISPGLL